MVGPHYHGPLQLLAKAIANTLKGNHSLAIVYPLQHQCPPTLYQQELVLIKYLSSPFNQPTCMPHTGHKGVLETLTR